MRYTLLDLTQRILGSMESDEVSSITDTPEATDVANIVKECYFDLVGKLSSPESVGLFKFDAMTDNTKPCALRVPSNVASIEWVKYLDYRRDPDDPPWTKELRYVSNEEFLYYQDGFDLDEDDVSSMTLEINSKNWDFKFYNNRTPSYYTIFDESLAVFDAYDSDFETTLTEAGSMGYGSLLPEWRFEDNFIPDLDPRQFQLLLQEAKSTAHVELKQAQNVRAEQKARSNFILAQKQKSDNNPMSSIQNHYQFGRGGTMSQRDRMKRAMRMGR